MNSTVSSFGNRNDGNLTALLHETLQADSLDSFVTGLDHLLRAKMPHHSVCISFNNLDYFNPWLIRDTQPGRCSMVYLKDRYCVLDPTPSYLRQRIGLERSTFREQWATLPSAHRALYYERFMHREGWDKYAEIHFWNGRHLDASICVRRSPAQADFTAGDLRLLSNLRSIFAPCVRRLHRLRHERGASRAMREIFLKTPIPLIVLDWSLEPVCFNFEARRLCWDWIHGPERARAVKAATTPEIPREILSACEERRQEESTACDAPAWSAKSQPSFTTVLHPTRADLSAQVELIGADAADTGSPNFLLRLQKLPANHPRVRAGNPSAAADVDGNGALALLACLTRCEREVALQVKDGYTNGLIASRLHKSEATVKMQVHSIFKKLKVSNRTQLATLLH